MRIPEQARAAFGGKTTIRQHLGNISEAEAVARAAQLAAHYKRLFDQHTRRTTKPKDVPPNEATTVRFFLDRDIAQRFINTWRTRETRVFSERLKSLREANDREWNRLEKEIERSLSTARKALRAADGAPLQQALASVQGGLNICIESTHSAMTSLIHDFNGARVAFLTDCAAVVRGEAPVTALPPLPESQLPLTDLYGTPASEIAVAWKERVISDGGEVNLKTFDKYTAIADDLGTIMSRRPIQSVTTADIDALKALWTERKNGSSTIKDKLDMLLSMLRPFDSNNRLQELVTKRLPRGSSLRAVRLPFTNSQARQFLGEVFDCPKVRKDDRMLVALLFMLGARIEELYQLRSTDLIQTDYGWVVRFADHRQTGSGDASLKNGASARRLPLLSGVVPELDDWLQGRLESGGFLFPDGSINKYNIRSAAAARRLNRRLRSLFPDDGRLVLQSTRPTANRAMRRADTDPRIRRRFLGHADNGVHERHYDPGELLDDRDLLPGATALSEFLQEIRGHAKRPAATRVSPRRRGCPDAHSGRKSSAANFSYQAPR